MTSYISGFKPLWLALAMIAAVEGLLAFLPSPSPYLDKFYGYAFRYGDAIQVQIVERKMKAYLGRPAEFVQIGDSSGYFGVQPEIVGSYLPGYRYLNVSATADTGYAGYRHIAEAYLRENPQAQYLVLHTTLYCLPLRYGEGASRMLERLLISPLRHLYELPSLRYRLWVTNLLYYGKGDFVATYNDLQPHAALYMQDVQHGGWAPMPRLPRSKQNVPDGPCRFDFLYDEEGRATLKPELEKIKALADRHHVRLVLLFNPVACQPSEQIQPVLDNINDFLKENPDVALPMPVMRVYPKEAFHDPWHLIESGAARHSHEVGQALADMLAGQAMQPKLQEAP